MNAVFNAALPVFSLILVGYLSARLRILGAAATDSLNRFVIYLALPALLFAGGAKMTFHGRGGFLAAFAGGMLATFALAWALGARRKARLGDISIEGITAAYANTAFMGIPVCMVAFGPDSLPPVIVATLLTACVLFGLAVVLIEMDGHRGAGLGRAVAKVLRSLARNPLVFSPAAGLLLAALGLPLPAAVDNFTRLLGSAASPCALVCIGLFLAETKPGQGNRLVSQLVALKLLGQPAVTGILAYAVFPMDPLWAKTALLLSAMPTGTGPFMLARLYDREAGMASRAILISTVLSVISVSILLACLS